MDIVRRACEEYKENPMMATMSRACALDKRILAAACKHVKMTGESAATVDMLWRRLGDLYNAVEVHMRNDTDRSRSTDTEVTYIPVLPPISIYYEAVSRMIDQGLLQVRSVVLGHGRRGHGNASASADGDLLSVKHAVVSLRAEMTDVVAAIKGDKRLHLTSYLGD
jgi:hypothetical protein